MSPSPPPPSPQRHTSKQALHNRNVCCANPWECRLGQLFVPPRKSAETVQKQPQKKLKNPNGPPLTEPSAAPPSRFTVTNFTLTPLRRLKLPPPTGSSFTPAPPPPPTVWLQRAAPNRACNRPPPAPPRACCATVKQPGLHASSAGIVSLRRYCCA
jgi:hypothetical protein